MGCDIHCDVEAKTSTGWWLPMGQDLEIGRDYALFSAMADVRNGENGDSEYIEPVAAPRGWPKGAGYGREIISDAIQHSRSWLSAAEFREAIRRAEEYLTTRPVSAEAKAILAYMEALFLGGEYVEVRIFFGFDN